jgi:hypothetical protein
MSTIASGAFDAAPSFFVRSHSRAALVLIPILLAGCAAAPVLGPISKGAAVSVVVTPPTETSEPVPIRNQALRDGASAGAGSGMMIGGLWGLACGPFAPLCVPLGAAAGVVTGMAAGAVVGVTGALSAAQAEHLRERLERTRKTHDILDDLRARMTDRASKQWVLDGPAPVTRVMLELKDLELTSTRDERVSLSLLVLVTVQRDAGDQKRQPDRKVFAYKGPLSALAIWLDDRSDFIDTSLSAASQQMAAEIVSELSLDVAQ